MSDLGSWGSLQVFDTCGFAGGDVHSGNGAQLYLSRQWPQLQTGTDHLHSWQTREMRHESQQFELENNRSHMSGGKSVDESGELCLDHAGTAAQALNLARRRAL